MIKPMIPQYFLVLISLLFSLFPYYFRIQKTTKQTPFKTLDLIHFIFLLAILRFVFEFSEFHSHSLRDRPCGTLITSTRDLCTCSGLKPIKFLAPFPGKCFAPTLRGRLGIWSIKFLTPFDRSGFIPQQVH